MKSIQELMNKFTKKSVGNKSSHIVESPSDESTTLWSRLLDNSERPYIPFDITEQDIYQNLNEGRDE
jgi:hypothetical protein